MVSIAQSLAIAVLRLQGRKRRWSNGAALVAAAREHSEATGALRVTPVGTGPRTVLYLHGGGFIHDFAPQHWSLISYLADAGDATVRAVHYPLAPAYTWRDSFEAVLALARDCDVLVGDSAGGGYALAIAQALATEGVRPDLVLIAPLVDLSLSDPLTAQYDAADPWLAADGTLACGLAWAGEDDVRRPELSPLFGEFAGLGRVLVFSGTRDVLHPQALALARASEDIELVVAPGSVHVYPLLPIPEAKDARERMAEHIRTATT